jgi:uncharacterized protein (DUF885 family)
MLHIYRTPATIRLAWLWAAILLAFSAAAEAQPDWIAESNRHSQLVLDLLARYNPEAAAGLGVDGYDESIRDLRDGVYERSKADTEELLVELKNRHRAEKHPQVAQDLGILVKAVEDDLRSEELNRANMLPYYNVSRQVFGGVRALIDEQIPRNRYPAAVVRLARYAGLEEGYTPITELAKDRTRERFDVEGLQGPYRGEVEQDLERSETFISGLEELMSGTDLQGWQEPVEVLSDQLREYNEWIRDELLPRARDDFRLPPAMYADALRNWGVDDSPEELIRMATQGYMDIRNEMVTIAPLIAKEKGYSSSNYRDVIRALKDEGQIDGDRLLDRYREILGEIEKIVVEQRLVTLPDRPAGIRIATAAETAAQPAAHVDLPRLIGNTGEYPQFVIPKLVKLDDGSWERTDDTYEAGAWTLTAHEARPGHELQFSTMIENGVSLARAIFAFNSANVEGWGLYAEAIAKPYLPLDAQLISLQFRLMRAARMFLDPMLNLGRISPENAKKLLMEDVVVEEGWARNEIERYTYRIPGQATAYYYGYLNMQSLRTQTELALREDFDQLAFHDFVLDQGLLPPHILKRAVLEEFVASQR